MCGISGILGINNHAEIAARMNTAIKHRGPDSDGVYSDKILSLAHTRLSILDLSDKANQPFYSKCGNFILILNGEIYNHITIRKELTRNISFETHSDTETLLYALIEHGSSIITKLNGIFAFAFYNIKEQEILLARDYIGVKPLYFYQKENIFSFSSEIKSFYKIPNFDTTLNHNAIFDYAQFGRGKQDETHLKHVKKIKSGHYIKFNINDLQPIEQIQYYKLKFTNQYHNSSEKGLVDKLDTLLVSAIQKQLQSDVPFGFMLSGGLDSSLIVAIASKLTKDKLVCFTAKPSQTDLKKEGFGDDLVYAEKVASLFNCDLNIINTSDILFDKLDYISSHLDEPIGDTAPYNLNSIAIEANKKGIKVLFSGVGADDIFSGYRRHQAIYYREKIHILGKIKFFIESLTKLFLTKNNTLRRVNKFFNNISNDEETNLINSFKHIDAPLFSSVLQQKYKTNYHPSTYYHELINEFSSKSTALNKILSIEINSYLPDNNLLYHDKICMANGIEARVPFLDKELVEFSLTIPSHLKMNKTATKYLLKKVAERYLPKDIIYRKKTGFGIPLRRIITENINTISSILLNKNEPISSFFDSAKLNSIINDNKNNKIDCNQFIWNLITINNILKK